MLSQHHPIESILLLFGVLCSKGFGQKDHAYLEFCNRDKKL